MSLLAASNGPRQRDKIYGKKRRVPLDVKQANLSLFASDDTSASLEKAVAQLSIKDVPGPSKTSRTHAATIDKQQPVQNEVWENIDKDGDEQRATPKPYDVAEDAPDTITDKKVDLSDKERLAIQPLLALPRIAPVVRNFRAVGRQLAEQFDVRKLNEGSYSDCFVVRRPGCSVEKAVLKIIPLQCDRNTVPIAGASQSSDFLREVKLLSALEDYHGFAQIFKGRVARGKMHENMIQAARKWLEDTTEDVDKTIDPATRYPDDQIYGIIEMGYAGQDLELLAWPSAFQAYDAFWITAILLANAESRIEFEHRDLHMSNICFRPGATGLIDVSDDFVQAMEAAPAALLGLSGLDISIIDYTHSRMRDPESGEILFNPECAFTASDLAAYKKNRKPCDQFDTVIKAEEWMSRHHQTLIKNGATNTPNYQSFTPKTNVMWLSHVLHRLTAHSSLSRKRFFYIPGSSSTARKVQADLWKKLGETLALIGSAELDSLPESAERFLAEAIEGGFVGKEEVSAFMERLNLDSAPERS